MAEPSVMQMMTPFQMANIVVQTYPWVPDTGALLNQLAAQEGQPSAIELLGFGDSGVPPELAVMIASQMRSPQLISIIPDESPDL